MKRLRILGKSYTVKHVPADTFEGRFGDCDIEKLVIRICRGQEPQQYADTVLHEAMHAIWAAYALPKASEERIVAALASGLIALLSDNGEPLPRFLKQK